MFSDFSNLAVGLSLHEHMLSLIRPWKHAPVILGARIGAECCTPECNYYFSMLIKHVSANNNDKNKARVNSLAELQVSL